VESWSRTAIGQRVYYDINALSKLVDDGRRLGGSIRFCEADGLDWEAEAEDGGMDRRG